jgi:multidrug efflux system membrane fusion protein
VLTLPQDGDPGQVLDRGRVQVVDNEVDQTTGTIKLKATFANPDLRLWPGAFVNVRLALRLEQGVTTVPMAAVQRGPQGDYVYIATAQNTVRRVPITISHQDDIRAIVTSGVRPGERVVTDGASRLSDGAAITKLE